MCTTTLPWSSTSGARPTCPPNFVPPFTYRPLVPWLASLLPFSPITGINFLNQLFLIVGLIFLYGILSQLGFKPGLRLLGCSLYVFSFPTFYYGTIGYVDPVAIGILTAGTWLIVTERWVLLAPVMVVGMAVKETLFLLLPIAIVVLVARSRKRRILLATLLTLLVLAACLAVRIMAPGDDSAYLWYPQFSRVVANLSLRGLCRRTLYLDFLSLFHSPGAASSGSLAESSSLFGRRIEMMIRDYWV